MWPIKVDEKTMEGTMTAKQRETKSEEGNQEERAIMIVPAEGE